VCRELRRLNMLGIERKATASIVEAFKILKQFNRLIKVRIH